MNNEQLRDAIYNGDIETTRKALANVPDGKGCSQRIDLVSELNPLQKTGRTDLVSWILKSEHDHPGHFLTYKAILDMLAQKEGVGAVMQRWKHPIFWVVECSRNGKEPVAVPVPTSPQMSGYLGYLEDLRAVPVSDNTRSKEVNKHSPKGRILPVRDLKKSL